jgi:hypothetical protein
MRLWIMTVLSLRPTVLVAGGLAANKGWIMTSSIRPHDG